VQVVLVLGVLLYVLFGRRLARQLARRDETIPRERINLLACAVAWLALVLFFQRVVPFDRTWIFLVPLYGMFAAAGLAWLVRDRVWFAAGTLLLAGGIAVSLLNSDAVRTSELTGYAPDAEAIALYAIEHFDPDDRLLAATLLDETVRYYLRYHGADPAMVVDKYEVAWMDLLHAFDRRWFAVGTPDASPDAFQATFELLPPDFTQHTLYELFAPTLPAGILFSDNFETALALGWTFQGVQPEVVRRDDNRRLALDTTDWAQISVDGGRRWRDYALELMLTIERDHPEYDDVVLHVRNDYDVGSAAAVLDATTGTIGIGGDRQRAWAGTQVQSAYPLEMGRVYAVSLAVQGDTVTLRLDGETVLEAAADGIARGSFRIVLPPGVRVLLDDVVVREF
jgi:hypothetical protein